MKNKRHAKILDIISQSDTVTQSALTQKLCEQGFPVTQATVSRDIKELGLVKVAAGKGYKYALPANVVAHTSKHMTIFSQSVISVEYALHTIVVKTLSGMAQAAGAAVDSSIGQQILGSIAGDDTLIIVTESEERAKELTKILRDMQAGA
ncbi:MAG TPA: hypothetical protein IAC74_07160 [Candidatus Aphodoplasma excrementigallinarum]|uniref:Arginine repressor n=1 Tax=Candidatus Aphodoplasma excrementigallinarum TaxID=2840673 RepID=A0A9D1T020_9FIRM|nr:hypothetical protein [Candidatus Aphodoplasma excrementigallinarum]